MYFKRFCCYHCGSYDRSCNCWVQGQRRIPIQYAKRVVGRKMYGGHSTRCL